jgi:Fe2+ transport system protein FeoA
MARRIQLTHLAPGKRAKIVEIQAGMGLIRRLEALGIRTGQKIETVSMPFMRGPVTVRSERIRTAIGHRAASKILVEVEDGQQ